jgi:hypothetical protein
LKTWLDAQEAAAKGKPLYLAYFGKGHPRWYGIDAKALPDDPLSGNGLGLLKPGLYCISATILQSVYAPEIGPWCRPDEAADQTALANKQLRTESSLPQSDHAPLIANRGAPSIKNIKEFERLRFSRLCAYLRHRQPTAEVGHSILVFDLDAAELDKALYGPPHELNPEVRVLGY